MRIPKSAARKRRLAVLRQMSSSDGEEAVGFSDSGSLDRLPDDERDFVAACGASLPLRLSVRNERSGEVDDVLIERPWAVIGGAENCDLRVLHPDISQRHTYLQFADGRLFCCDLASRTGTHWSSESPSRGWLTPGEPIFLGTYSLRPYPNDFREDASAEPVNSGNDSPSTECPPVAFTIANVLGRSGRPKIRRIRRTVTLAGASQVCPLRLQHASVGRVHCSFVWTPRGLWVVDLLCAGGTLVNGQVASVALLGEGDEVSIGRFQLQVTYAPPAEDESEPAAPAESASEISVAAPPRSADSSIAPRTALPPIVFAAVDPEPEPADTAAEPVVEMVPATIARTAAEPAPETAPVTAQEATTPPPIAAAPSEPANGLMAFSSCLAAIAPIIRCPNHVAMAMMQQFSAMQQQLFDHTQQLLAAMSQAFSAAHTRQLELIRGELFRVHEVNRELQELNLELTISRQLHPQAADSPSRSKPALRSGDAPLREPRSGSPRFSRDEPRPPRSGRGHSDAPGLHSTGRDVSELDPPTSQTDETDAGTDARLSDRIQELEQERANRWEKIMQILTPAGASG